MKTRFCPSPSGHIHLGNLRTALFSYWWAKSQGGTWLLRIEDTDAERSDLTLVQTLLDDLAWLGVKADEGVGAGGEDGPYYQSERTAIYHDYAQRLLASGHAYWCFCSPETLEADRQAQKTQGKPPRYVGRCRDKDMVQAEAQVAQGKRPTLRFRVPTTGQVTFDDQIKGPQSMQCQDCGDFVLLKSDGGATFLFSNALDDALMGVTHVIRGDDHLSNTPKQRLILEALGLTPPCYAHLSLVVDPTRQPLSKRRGSASLHDLRERGVWPLALLNTLARLGHGVAEHQVLGNQALAQAFAIDRVSRSASQYDPQQLDHWQKEVIKTVDAESFWSWVGQVPTKGPLEQERLERLLRETLVWPADAQGLLDGWLSPTLSCPQGEAWACVQEAGPSFFTKALELWPHSSDARQWLQALSQATGLKGRALYMPIRVALTGVQHGPSLQDLVALLAGRSLIIPRLNDAIAWWRS